MPTRKQRRRREKDFRHDVRVFEVDEEGNEVPISELRAREEKAPARSNGSRGAEKGRGARRPAREVQPPSWSRAIRRGGLMGGAMLLVFVFFLRTGPLVQRAAIGVFYAVVFVPLTYWIDRTAYRTSQRRAARDAGKGKKS
jgi:hypothetical protein